MTHNLYGRGTIVIAGDGVTDAWQVSDPDGRHLATIVLGAPGDGYGAALMVLGLSRPHELNPAISELRDGGIDTGDRWGSCMTMLGAACAVLYAVYGRIPDGAGYSPAWGASTDLDALADVDGTSETGENAAGADYATANLASAHRDGRVSVRDLELAAVALSRWADVLKAAGQDY